MEKDSLTKIRECLYSSCRGFRPGLYCPIPDDVWDAIRDLVNPELRLMSLDDVKRSKGADIFLEIFNYPGEPPYLTAATLDGVGAKGVSFYVNGFDYAVYNTACIGGWRCWTHRPDEKTRGETQWKKWEKE